MHRRARTDDPRRSYVMSRIKSRNTSIELKLRKALWRAGVRYRLNCGRLPGSPDIAITKYQIAVFCDGEFWHGKGFANKKPGIKNNREYWLEKIQKNRDRDRRAEWSLGCLGWTVLRFWGQEIKKDTAGCVREIKAAILARQLQNAAL